MRRRLPAGPYMILQERVIIVVVIIIGADVTTASRDGPLAPALRQGMFPSVSVEPGRRPMRSAAWETCR